MTTLQAAIINEIKAIPDPEIPVITIEELGILKKISIENNILDVTITPTYTGCPAMQHIENDIKKIQPIQNIYLLLDSKYRNLSTDYSVYKWVVNNNSNTTQGSVNTLSSNIKNIIKHYLNQLNQNQREV